MSTFATQNIRNIFSRILLLLSISVLTAFSIPRSVNAQAIENCDEQRLRNLGVLLLACDPTEYAAAGGACTTPLAGNGNAEQIWNYLIGKGFTPQQTAGIMGNMQAEAGFRPKLVEYGWKNSRGETSVPGEPSSLDDNVPPDQNEKGQPGYGIVQWTSPGRKQGLRVKATAAGIIAGTLSLQLDYLWEELNGSYKSSTLDPILASTTVEQASDIFLDEFEKPGNREATRPVRRAMGLAILTQYGSGTSTSPASSPGGCGPSAALPPGECPKDPIPESETVVVQGIKVHPCIAAEVDRIMTLAKTKAAPVSALSGWGWRSNESQIALRKKHCGTSQYAIYQMPAGQCNPPTARPGSSQHERGTAVDFNCNGKIGSHSNACFIFLDGNTSLKNLPSEPWHWSVNGR